RTVTALRNISEGEGDLTQRLDDNGDDEVAELSHSFNQFIEQIHTIVSEVDG
ncbi:MAG: HAMP domain-containing protein, partial [Anaerolineae bacterium]|nr:HAMP domain-containing protein [Anaerolineae bacterium]